MSKHEPFRFKNIEELLKKAEELNLDLPCSDSIDILFDEVKIGRKKIPNRLAVQPMEGFDSEKDGSPGELTFRRYKRYAEGGSGLIWFEATSISQNGKSNGRQLFLHDLNVGKFEKLVSETKKAATDKFGKNHNVYLVLQLTHSGRFSKPYGRPEPLIACENPYLNTPDSVNKIVTDEELDILLKTFVKTSKLACKAGFDAVDIKACHGYLFHELMSVYLREDSRYGGPELENRAKFLTESAKQIKDNIKGLDASVRFNIYDGIPYPHGFGMKTDGSTEFDLEEPLRLVKMLADEGSVLFNGTAGIPYVNAHIGRPFNRPVKGSPKPDEHPLKGVSRLIEIIGIMQKSVPDIPFVGTGYSWLRNLFPFIGAGAVKSGLAQIIGMGRCAFAYPDAPLDLMENGKMDPKKVCISCSSCTELMRHGHVSGCMVKDVDIYKKEYMEILR